MPRTSMSRLDASPSADVTVCWPRVLRYRGLTPRVSAQAKADILIPGTQAGRREEHVGAQPIAPHVNHVNAAANQARPTPSMWAVGGAGETLHPPLSPSGGHQLLPPARGPAGDQGPTGRPPVAPERAALPEAGPGRTGQAIVAGRGESVKDWARAQSGISPTPAQLHIRRTRLIPSLLFSLSTFISLFISAS